MMYRAGDIAQLMEHLANMHTALDPLFSASYKLGTVAHTCNLSAQEAAGSETQVILSYLASLRPIWYTQDIVGKM